MRKLILIFTVLVLISFPTIAGAVSLNFAWDASTGTGVTGYKLYYGKAHRSYDHSVDAGNVLTYTLTLDVTAGGTWFFTATAYSPSTESVFSNEISKTYAVGGVEVGDGGGWFWIP
jgi:hypothetical protein